MSAADRHGVEKVPERFEYEALTPIWEEALRSEPEDLGTLSWLGHAYTRLGRIEEGLAIDLRLTALRPEDPVARYNLACSYALLRRLDEAFESLDAAVDLGYRDPAHLSEDPDLDPLRSDPRFTEIVARLRVES